MNISLRQLRAFLAVAESGSFTRAASAIGLSQSATSITVRELEETLRVRLLDRTTRQVQLTDSGRMLAATGKRALGELEACLEEIRDIGAQRKGRVVIACVPSVASALMPDWLPVVARRLPNVRVSLFDNSAADVLRRVRLGEVEIGIAGGVEEEPDLVSSLLLSDPMCLVCRRDHPLAARRVVEWRELHGERLVMLGSTSGSHHAITRHLIEQKIDVDVVLELAQPQSVLGMVAGGLGIAVMPRLAIPVASRDAIVVCALGAPRLLRPILALRRADRSLSPAAEGLWALLHELCAPHRVPGVS